MKKSVRVSAIVSVAFLVAASINSFAKKQPGKTTPNNSSGITYVVLVDNSNIGFCHSYNVVIRDEAGNIIGSPLEYQEGLDNYIFHESGPVLGTRKAQLERIEGSSQYQCKQLVNIQPDRLTGKFRNGATYLFNLKATARPGHD